MDSVLDRIGTSDSDTSDKDYQRPTKKISLKAVVDALDNSPIKKSPSVIVEQECQPTPTINKIDFGLAKGSNDEEPSITKQMPTLIPAPTFNRNNSNEGSETKSLPKIVKKEKFWEYEEVDDKPKEKRKRKLPNELARLQDTEEYMEANNAIKSDSTSSERSKRPPRRAAILARENVNFLHGNVENGLELRGTRKALEKEKEDSFNSSRDSIDSDEEEKPDRSAVDDILANSDLFDADEATEPPKKEKKPPETKNDMITLHLPPKPKKRKSEEPKRTTDPPKRTTDTSKKMIDSPISPRVSRSNLLSDMFGGQSHLTSFKIPKKKRDGDETKQKELVTKQKEPSTKQKDVETKSPKESRDKERRRSAGENGKDRSEKRPVEKSEKRLMEKTEKKTKDKLGQKVRLDTKISTETGGEIGKLIDDQQRWTQRVNDVKRQFAEWVKTLPDRRKNKLP